jgi:hypothetical protein
MPDNNKEVENLVVSRSLSNSKRFIVNYIFGLSFSFIFGVLLNKYVLTSPTSNAEPSPSTILQNPSPTCPKIKSVECEKFYQGLENAAWVEYNSKFYSLDLPSGVRISESTESPLLRNSDDVILATHINKEGPTQIHETESYDGIYLEFIILPKKGLSLQQIAQNSFEELKKEDVDAGIGFKQSSIGDYSAWEYTYTPYLGAKYIFLEENAESQEYLRIVDMTEDPTNQGYESLVNKIVASITFL